MLFCLIHQSCPFGNCICMHVSTCQGGYSDEALFERDVSPAWKTWNLFISFPIIGIVFGTPPMPRKWGPRRFRDTSVWLHNWVVLSNMFYFHPFLGKISNLANIFQMGGSTTNQTITLRPAISWPQKLAAWNPPWHWIPHRNCDLPMGLQAALPSASTPAFNFDLLLLGSWIWKGKRNIRKDVNQIVRICYVS